MLRLLVTPGRRPPPRPLPAVPLGLPLHALLARCTSTSSVVASPLPPPHTPPQSPHTPLAKESVWGLVKQMVAKKRVGGGEGGKPKDESAPLNRVTFPRLLQLVRPELIPMSAAVGTLAVTTGISLIFPFAIGRIVDTAISPDAVATPAAISLGLLGLFVVQSGLITLRSALLTVSGERIAAFARRDLFRAVLAQEVAWFDAHRTGDVISRLTADTTIIHKALTSNVANGLRAAAMAVGGTAMLVYLSPKLALLSCVLLPPIAVAGVGYGRYLQGQQRAVQEALSASSAAAEEVVSQIRTVRQFAREREETERYSGLVFDTFSSAKRIGIVAAYFDGFVHMAANASLIAVLWYGGELVASGALSPGDLTAFLMYSVYTGFNAAALSSVYSELKRAAGAAGRIFEVIDREPGMPLYGLKEGLAYWTAGAEPTDVVGSGLLRRLAPTLAPPAARSPFPEQRALLPLDAASLRGDTEFRGVGFAYPSRPDVRVLSDFSLAVPAGATLALVGGSGSGKSTVAALLTRLYDPQAGAVLLDGREITELDPRGLRNAIGVVAQEPALFAASLAANIRYGKPDASDEEVRAAAALANAHGFISGFPQGYDTLVGERGVQLSGGQRQRIALARAIVKSPRILLLDEATSALDAESEAAVMEALEKVRRGRTVITIAHRLSTMQSADLVAVLAGGRVVEVGPFGALFNDAGSAFRALVERQLLGGTGPGGLGAPSSADRQ